MKPGRNDTASIPAFVERRGFCYDIMAYKDTDAQSLDPEQSRKFLESYERLRSTLGYVSYTDVSRELGNAATSHATCQVSPYPIQRVVSPLLL